MQKHMFGLFALPSGSSSKPWICQSSTTGGIISYGKTVRNALLVKRCQDLAPVFAKLRRSPAPLAQKLSALPRKLWARALHGISGCPLASAQLAHLRAAAVRALRINAAGTSALLRLSIGSDLTVDPGFYQLWQVMQDLRRMCRKHATVVRRWKLFMQWHGGEAGHGPFHKVLQVLSQVGWSVAEPPQVVDHEQLTFNILTAPNALLRRRLESAWLRYVALSQAHRPSMAGMQAIDPCLLQQDVASLGLLDAARLNALRSGAFLFDHAHAKYDCTKTGLCVRCSVPDTRQHRVCECPAYAEVRAPFAWVCTEWPRLPQCLTHHLLPPANPFLPDLHRSLVALPDLSDRFFSSTAIDGKQHLFTDGSCLLQTPAEFALAAWGVINATSGCVISSGPVPGLLQSSPRAELWALISALKWGLWVRVSVVLWTDSLKGAEGVRKLLEDATWLPEANAGLWTLIAELVACYTVDTLDIQHVPSHLREDVCETPLEEWLACWNNKVDRLAGQTNLNRDVALANAHAQALAYHQRLTEVMRALRGIYFGIAEQTAHGSGITAEDPFLEEVREDAPAIEVQNRLHEEVPLNWLSQATSSCSEFPASFVQSACNFLLGQDLSSTECFEVSWVELVFMVLVSDGIEFPCRCPSSGAWKVRQDLPFAPAMTVAVQLRTLQTIWRRALGTGLLEQFLVKGLDRCGFGVCFPLDGLRVGCNQELLRQARQSLSVWACPPVRSVGQLARMFHR